MLDYLLDFINLLGHWSYLVIFVIVLLECQPLLGLVMPGESLVLIGGFLSGQGELAPGLLIVVIAAAAIIGDSIGFELGRKLGRGWLLQRGNRFGLRQEHLDRVDDFIARHGGKAVFTGHFLHLMRALMPFVAGASRISYPRFLVINAAGCIVWSFTFVMLGYAVGESWRRAAHWVGRASEIVGGVLLFAIAVVWLWRWLVRHETEVRRRWQAIVDQPRMAAMRRRFAPQLEFLVARLSPQGYLGLHLTIGLVCIIGASWLFGGIAEDVVSGEPLTVIDVNVAQWFHERTTPGMQTAMLFVTALASPVPVTGVALITAFFLGWRRCWYRLLALVLALSGGMMLAFLLKLIFHRNRPDFTDSFMVISGFSFPSGHTMAATLLCGVLAVFAVITLKGWRWRVRAVLSACIVIVLVGFSRVYLGAHFLSDVLGAATAGLAWLAFCLTAVDTLRRYREAKVEKGRIQGAA